MGYTLTRQDGKWHCYFLTRDGKRFRRSTKQSDKRRAAFVADEWFRRLADPTYQAANSTTIADASGRLKEALVDAGRSPATIQFYTVKLSQVARVLGADVVLSAITAARVDDYIRTRKAEGAKRYTISKELTALRQLLKHARRRGEFDRELSQVMPIGFATGYKPRQRRLTQGEVWQLIDDLAVHSPGVARYVAFVCATTGRDAAVHRALGKHLTPDGVEVYDFKTKRARRVVPLNEVTREFVAFAFDGVGGDAAIAPGVSSVRHALDRAAKRLKLDHLSPNDLRRSVAHWLLERGVPRDAAASFMGHANTKMLDAVYGKLDSKELGATIRRSLALTAGSSLDGSRINGFSAVDEGDSVDDATAEKPCAGRESNPRHGDFQPFSVPDVYAGIVAKTARASDESWICAINTSEGAPAPSGALTGPRPLQPAEAREEPAFFLVARLALAACHGDTGGRAVQS